MMQMTRARAQGTHQPPQIDHGTSPFRSTPLWNPPLFRRGGSLSETTLMKIWRYIGQNEGVSYFSFDDRSPVTIAVGDYRATENDGA